MEELQFVEGQEVEVTWEEEHLKDAWFLAKVLQATPITRSRMNDKRLIGYRTLGGDKKRTEYVHVSLLRPLPPQGKTGSLFKLNEVVDVYKIGVWWKGVVNEILESSRCKVCLSNSNEMVEFGMENLRIHRDWINGRWDPPVEEHEQETPVIKENQDELDSPIPTESTVLSNIPMPMKACLVRRTSIGSCTSEEEQHHITTPVPEGNRRKSLPSLPLLMKEPLGDIDIKKHRKVQSGQKKDCVLGKKRPAAKDSSRKTPVKGIKLQKSDKEKPEDLAMGVNLITKGVSHENQFMETVIINGQASSPDSLGLENLLASAECPNSLVRQTVLEQYHKTEDEQNETVPHYLSVISRTSTPCQEMNIASYPLQKDENVFLRSSPFVKSLPLSPLWECVDSMKALKSIRQQRHFRGLGIYSEKL